MYELMKHQKEAITFGLNNKNFLLADEMGLGKTATLIKYAEQLRIDNKFLPFQKCLIITGVNGLKYNWYNEVNKFSNLKPFILGITNIQNNNKNRVGGSNLIINDLLGAFSSNIDKSLNDLKTLDIAHLYVNKAGLNEEILKDYYYLITNIESLRNNKILKVLQYLIRNEYIKVLILDEAQCIKSFNSLQSKAIRSLNYPNLYKVCATGTPIMNTPIDLYSIMYFLEHEKHNYYQFRNFYCIMGGYNNYEIVGYKHLDVLNKYLNKFMIRRKKEDILDLPDKIYTNEYVEMGNKQKQIYNEVKRQLLNDIDKILELPNPLVELLRLRQAAIDTSLLSTTINESAKYERLFEITYELKQNNNKFIIYSNFATVVKNLYNKYKNENINLSIITGDMSIEERNKELEKFNNNETDGIIGTIKALGTGYTLTAANTVIFVDEPWNNAVKEQAIDRIHRIGQNSNCNIITLLCKNSIDEYINETVISKKDIADSVVDNINITDKKELLYKILK